MDTQPKKLNFKNAVQKTPTHDQIVAAQEQVKQEQVVNTSMINLLPVNENLKEVIDVVNSKSILLNENLISKKQKLDEAEEAVKVADEKWRLVKEERQAAKKARNDARKGFQDAQIASETLKSFINTDARPIEKTSTKQVSKTTVKKEPVKKVETFCVFCKADDHTKDYCDVLKNTVCTICNEIGHNAKYCNSGIKKCYICKKLGHFAGDCWFNPENQQNQ